MPSVTLSWWRGRGPLRFLLAPLCASSLALPSAPDRERGVS
jgi:hypothetical protein